MKALISLGFAALFLWLVYAKVQADRQIAADKRTINDYAEKQKALDETPSFDLQSRCAEHAKQFFDRGGWGKDDEFSKGVQAEYLNHYNSKLHKCFITIKTYKWQSATKSQLTSKDVFDAVEGQSYGEYVWASDPNKKYWEVPPISCRATKPDGTTVNCKDDDEYTAIMASYMNVDG